MRESARGCELAAILYLILWAGIFVVLGGIIYRWC